MDLTHEQWAVLEPLMPKVRRRSDGRGRPRRPDRGVLNGILWILRTGAPWMDLPDRYPPYQTCHRQFQHRNRDGTFGEILHALAPDLKERGGICIEESFIDGTFVPAKKRGQVNTKRGKGTKIMSIADCFGLPIAVSRASASPHEVTLVESTV